jgi:protease-4
VKSDPTTTKHPRERGAARLLSRLAAAGSLALLPLAAAAFGCEGRPPHAGAEVQTEASEATRTPAPRIAGNPSTSVVELDLSKGIPEEMPTSLFGSPPRRSHLDLIRSLRTLAEGAGPKGVFVRLGTAGIGLARAQEVGGLLGAARGLGVPVVCHADEYNNGSLLLAASGCSKLWVSPAGGVEAIGIAAQLLYANKLFERLHISVDFLQVGKYKGALEPFTRDGPSPEARESLEGALRGMRAAWLASIAEGRGKPAVADLVEDGPFSSEEAQQQGLVDAVGYLDEAREDMKKLAGVEQIVPRFGGHEGPSGSSRGIVSLFRAIAGSGQSSGARVAVVPAVGAIAMTSARTLPLGGGDGISESNFGRVLTRLTNEANVKAVVIRIDSPGGSALASDLLWKKLMKLREKKPLVFSIGSMAASGGYYLACTGHEIVAEPTSIIGSIGVVGGKLAIGKALEEFGVHAEIIAAAPDPQKAARSSYQSPFSAWDEPTRRKVLASMTAVYDLFLRRVAEGRGTTVDKIAPSAEGRLWSGAQAKERGLIDEIGGFNDALKLSTKLAGLPEDAPFEVIGDAPALFDLLDSSDPSGEDRAGRIAEGARRAAVEAMSVPSIADLPELGSFIGSLAPLLQGEHTLAAMPFGLTIR